MATSEVTIANLALGKLGAGSIIAMDEESTEARACRLHYAPTRDEVLRSHRWNFAIRPATLVQTALTTEFSWTFQYALPTDCLRVLAMNAWDVGKRDGVWEIEGRYLMTDAETCQIKYISRVEDCNLFDSLFVEALSIKLASKIALPVNGSGPMASSFLTEYEKVTGGRARRTDAFESRSERQPAWINSDLVAARFIQGA
jgi:hypothetical protein